MPMSRLFGCEDSDDEDDIIKEDELDDEIDKLDERYAMSQNRCIRPNISPENDSVEKRLLQKKKKEMEYVDYMSARLNGIEFDPESEAQCARLFYVMALRSCRSRVCSAQLFAYFKSEGLYGLYLDRAIEKIFDRLISERPPGILVHGEICGPPKKESLETKIFGKPADEKMLDFIEGTYDPRNFDDTYQYVAFPSDYAKVEIQEEKSFIKENIKYTLFSYKVTNLPNGEPTDEKVVFKQKAQSFYVDMSDNGPNPPKNKRYFENFAFGEVRLFGDKLITEEQMRVQIEAVMRNGWKRKEYFFDVIRQNDNRIPYHLLNYYICSNLEDGTKLF